MCSVAFYCALRAQNNWTGKKIKTDVYVFDKLMREYSSRRYTKHWSIFLYNPLHRYNSI